MDAEIVADRMPDLGEVVAAAGVKDVAEGVEILAASVVEEMADEAIEGADEETD